MAKTTLIEQTTLSYDADGDLLYISFGDPQPADNSDLTDERVIIRLREGLIALASTATRRTRSKNLGSNATKILCVAVPLAL